MEKFLVKVLIASGILLGMLGCLNAAYVNTEYYKNLNDMRKFSEVPEHIDVANFGASHSTLAFNWDNYDEFDGMNMALGSQTLLYDEAFFNYYFDHFDENSTVIIDIMFKSLYEQEPNEKPYPSNVTRYYQVLSKDYIKQWNLEDALKYQFVPVLGNRQNAAKEIIADWQGEQTGPSEMEAHQVVLTELAGEPTQVLNGWEEDAMNKEGKRRAESFMKQSGNQEHGEQYDALIRMIEKCQAKDIDVILVTVPTLPCFYTSFESEFMDKFYAAMKEICEKYDLMYVNYTGDGRFLKDYRMYGDTDHLNGYGSVFFTDKFLEDNRDILDFYSGK